MTDMCEYVWDFQCLCALRVSRLLMKLNRKYCVSMCMALSYHLIHYSTIFLYICVNMQKQVQFVRNFCVHCLFAYQFLPRNNLENIHSELIEYIAIGWYLPHQICVVRSQIWYELSTCDHMISHAKSRYAMDSWLLRELAQHIDKWNDNVTWVMTTTSYTTNPSSNEVIAECLYPYIWNVRIPYEWLYLVSSFYVEHFAHMHTRVIYM